MTMPRARGIPKLRRRVDVVNIQTRNTNLGGEAGPSIYFGLLSRLDIAHPSTDASHRYSQNPHAPRSAK